MRVEHEGGRAAWVVGTMVAPTVQGYGLPQPLEYWPYQSLFSSLWYLTIRRPLRLVFAHSSAHSGTYRAPLPGVLLCLSVLQAHRGAPLDGVLLCSSAHHSLKGAPWVGSCSVVQCVRHLMGQPLCGSAADAGVWGKEATVKAPPLPVTQQYLLASMAAQLSSTGISHHSLLRHTPSIHLSTVNSSPHLGMAPQSLISSSQLLRLPGD